MSIPATYNWLGTVGVLPTTISEALKCYGVKEGAGVADNPVIMSWAAEIGEAAIGWKYMHDSIPWCGLFAAVIIHRAGKTLPTGPLYALNWSKFGVPAVKAALGDVLVFQRPGGGHVGFYVGEDDQNYCVLGGNQGDAVSFAWVAKDRCVAARRPVYNNQPASVKSYRLARSGEPVSKNEA